MVELIRVHRAHEADVVRDGADVREEVGELHTALAVFLEGARRAHDTRGLLCEEGEAHVLQHRFGQRLPVELVQHRLRIVEIHLARAALEVNVDDVFRARLVVRAARQNDATSG